MLTSQRYDPIAVALHWVMALLIIFMLALGFLMGDFPITIKFTAYNLHKSIGITIIALSLFRLVWRLLNPPPALPSTMSGREKFLAHAAHAMLYGLMIGLPLSGWLMVSALPKYPIVFFGLGEAPFLPMPPLNDAKMVNAWLNEVHELLAYGGAALILLHLGAALQHHFVKRDAILLRMLPKFLHPLVNRKAPR